MVVDFTWCDQLASVDKKPRYSGTLYSGTISIPTPTESEMFCSNK